MHTDYALPPPPTARKSGISCGFAGLLLRVASPLGPFWAAVPYLASDAEKDPQIEEVVGVEELLAAPKLELAQEVTPLSLVLVQRV
jgi:hypothetical protein